MEEFLNNKHIYFERGKGDLHRLMLYYTPVCVGVDFS